MFKSPDSDSAIDVEYAIGGSINMERPKIQSLWTPYLELLLKGHDDDPSKIAKVKFILFTQDRNDTFPLKLLQLYNKISGKNFLTF